CIVKIRVKTPSRLHFGIVDMRGDLGRMHVSVGVAIKKPNIILEVKKSDQLKVFGSRAERIKEYAEKIMRYAGIQEGLEFNLISDIPEHAGFGSGTQLALAVGTSISKTFNLNLNPDEIAFLLNRSRRSGVGVHAFKSGGFIIDCGHRINNPNHVPPLLFRSDVPEDWLFIVGLPRIKTGLSGMNEMEAFEKLEPPSKALVGEVSRTVLVQMIPAIIDKDIKLFGEAMTKLDNSFGSYWEKIQGGRYTHPIIEEGVNFLLERGVYGAGQSSWGPAFYGLVKGEDQAFKLEKELHDYLNHGERRGTVFYTGADNHGALITTIQN
ncbi:MAG: beta-ribofuranosylaminobenzene 5'-phosphate synthase family protein, partial [Candidatus Bathyarchaeia archaeon]